MKRGLRCGCPAGGELDGTELAPGLHALQCRGCEGSLLSMEDYRPWLERHPAGLAPAPGAAPLEQDEADGAARACPACSRLMQRLRVGSRPDFRLDRCSPCQLVWFGRGEWAALAHAGFTHRLHELLSDGWQRQLREDEQRQRRETLLRDRHGNDCIDELARIRDWLNRQPERDELLALLRAGW